MKITTTLFTCGSCLAPLNWTTQGVPTPYRLYYVKGGKAYFKLNNEEFMLKKDHFYLFPSTLPFLIRQECDDRLDHIFFNFIMSPSVVSSEPICLGIDSHPMFAVFLPLMESAVNAYRTTKLSNDKDTACAVLEAFLSLFCTVMPESQIVDSGILSSIEYIESHYNEPITVSDIASHVFLNEDYFIKKFRKAIGMTPYAYLSALRVRIAYGLIGDGASLADAAAAVGYQYASSLSHAMKKMNII